MWFCRKSKGLDPRCQGWFWGGGGGGGIKTPQSPRGFQQNPTKALDQKLTIPKNPMLFQLFSLKGEDTEPSS